MILPAKERIAMRTSRPNCRYMRRRAHHAGRWTDALEGWPLCRFCWRQKPPKIDWKKIERKKRRTEPDAAQETVEAPERTKPPKKRIEPLDEGAFREYCEEHGIACQFSVGWVFLRTPVAFWKIKHDRTEVLKVLHQSLRLDADAFKRKEHRLRRAV